MYRNGEHIMTPDGLKSVKFDPPRLFDDRDYSERENVVLKRFADAAHLSVLYGKITDLDGEKIYAVAIDLRSIKNAPNGGRPIELVIHLTPDQESDDEHIASEISNITSHAAKEIESWTNASRS